jgi:lipoate-protein ligase A
VIVDDLYDYRTLRQLEAATMFVVRADRATLVLGGSQSPDLLDPVKASEMPVRRRRGGGGLVLVRPEDLWVDWWIPHDDERWSHDVHVSSLRVGQWWGDALSPSVDGVRVHAGSLEGDVAFRVVCFAGRGPGEVFVNGRKAVGVTQWRVREGVLISTVLHAEPTSDVLDFLHSVPDGLAEALDHAALSSLISVDRTQVLARLAASSAPSRYVERVVDTHISS